ncbi:MAG: hypothetical protein LUD17_08065 [Bacteroidales bacterium]|nr:hypothetical protein [Bacteroidales bacterium]
MILLGKERMEAAERLITMAAWGLAEYGLQHIGAPRVRWVESIAETEALPNVPVGEYQIQVGDFTHIYYNSDPKLIRALSPLRVKMEFYTKDNWANNSYACQLSFLFSLSLPEHVPLESDKIELGATSAKEIRELTQGNEWIQRSLAFFEERVAACAPAIEERWLEWQRENELDLTVYTEAMTYAATAKESQKKRLAEHILLLRQKRATALIDTKRQKTYLLANAAGKALFCSPSDIQPKVMGWIKRECPDWDMDAPNIDISEYAHGQARLTWTIRSYHYSPADDEGFGEEEELPIVLACLIDEQGHPTSPLEEVPYIGPRR